MKKLLLGSTAIAVAGLVAGPAMAEDGKISLSVGGYYQNIVTFVSQDDDDINVGIGGGNFEIPYDREFNPVNVRHEGEIHFKGETTLDNGLNVGFQAQLEAITQGDQMDETYLYFSGSWGRLVMGSENSAPYLMAYAAPYAGLGINSPNFFMFSPSLSASAATSGYLNLASDANKITYFTPRFGGFQLGVSYTPNIDSAGGNRQTFGLNTDEDAGDLNHVIAAGVNFVESFNGVDVAIFAGAEWANREEDGVAVITMIPTPPQGTFFAVAEDDYQSYQAGLNIGFSGFTVGGSVSYVDAGFDDDFVDSDSDQWFYDVGATYSTGPWTVGLTYSYSDLELNGGALAFPFGYSTFESRRHMVELGASYALSPGVTIYGAGQWMKQLNDYEVDAVVGPDIDADQDTEGWGLSIGTKLSF